MAEEEKSFIKKLSTWEGIASLAAAVGLTVIPEAAVLIVTGICTVYGGVKLWQSKTKKD